MIAAEAVIAASCLLACDTIYVYETDPSGPLAGSGPGGDLAPLGASCTLDDACASGHCSRGACCDTACDTPCSSCARDSEPGRCGPASAGTDPAQECGEGQACNGAGSCEGGELAWVKTCGGEGASSISSLIVSASGDLVATGWFGGGIPLLCSDIEDTESNESDLFVVRMTLDGEPTACARFGSNVASEDVWVVGEDAVGDLYLAGSFGNSLDFGVGAHVSAGVRDIYLAKLTPALVPIWTVTFGSADFDQIEAAAVRPSGGLVVSGVSTEPVVVAGQTLPHDEDLQAFVAAFDATGALSYAQAIGGIDTLYALTAGADGTVYLGGAFNGTLDLGGGPVAVAPPGGSIEPFFAALNTNGTVAWVHAFQDHGMVLPESVAIDPSGDLLLAGTFKEATVDFGGGPIESWAEHDLFVARFDQGGEHRWSKRLGGFDDQGAITVAADAYGDLLLSGGYHGDIDLGGGQMVAERDGSSFIAKWSGDASHRWSRAFFGSHPNANTHLASAPNGAVLVAGEFEQQLKYGAASIDSAAPHECFVMKLSP